MQPSPRIYLAAPLFSEAERRYNAYVRDLLLQAGYDIYLPQEQGKDARHRTKEEDHIIFVRHKQALDHAQAVIAVCDGPDTDSGTAWEAGYACAKEIPLIALRTDTRMIGEKRRINLMLEQSSNVATSIEELLPLLSKVLYWSR
jgi:nucleoside 2-deoxyribosyltransferase